jgi:hypothetical protein
MQAFGGDVKYILTDEEYAMHVSNQLFITRLRSGFGKLASFYKVRVLHFFMRYSFMNRVYV